MIVADTSALISLATGDVLSQVVAEYEVHTTNTVIDELDTTSSYDDVHADAAERVLDVQDRLTVHDVDYSGLQSSRIDDGEASCITLAREIDPTFFLTDDLRALPELQQLVSAEVALSPIVLKALVLRDVLTSEEAETRLEQIAANRGWLGAPIYRRAQRLLD